MLFFSQSSFWWNLQSKQWKTSPRGSKAFSLVFLKFLNKTCTSNVFAEFLLRGFIRWLCIPRAATLGKRVMSRTCAVRYSTLSPRRRSKSIPWCIFPEAFRNFAISQSWQTPSWNEVVFSSVFFLISVPVKVTELNYFVIWHDFSY